MKLSFTRIIVVLLAVTLSWTACKKSTVKPAAKINEDMVARQIAMSLYKSLTGQMGGANVNNGVKAPFSIKRNGRSVYAMDPLCGTIIDTAYSNNTTSGDTSNSLDAKYHFVYTCSKDAVDGYTVYDSVKTESKNSTFVNDYTNVQDYTFKEIGQGYNKASASGTIITFLSNKLFATAGTAFVYHFVNSNFTLNDLVIANENGAADILSGSATFNAMTVDMNPTTPIDGLFTGYAGHIDYLGNFTARIYITNGGTYNINMKTGVITPL